MDKYLNVKGEVLEIKKGDKEVLFYNLKLNDDNKLQFNSSSLRDIQGPFVFNSKSGTLLIEKYHIKLDELNVHRLRVIEHNLKRDIVDLYTNIVNGNEKLIFLDSGLKDYPYFVTTEKILTMGEFSSKFNGALEYSFSEHCLRRFGIREHLKFNGFEELQRKLSKIGALMQFQNGYYDGHKVKTTTLRDVLKISNVA